MKRQRPDPRARLARRHRPGLALLLVAAACARADDGPGRSLRPALRWDGPAPEQAGGRVVHRFEVPAGAASWGNLHATSQILARGEGWSVGVWRGGGRLTLELPEDLPAFDSVVLRGSFRAAHSVELRLPGGGPGESWKQNVPGQAGQGEREVVFSRSDPDPEGPGPRELTLVVGGPDCTLAGLDFSVRGLGDTLPGTGDPRSVRLAGEGRVAVGLTPARTLSSEFECAPGDRLEFSFGRWPDRRASASAAQLRVAIETSGGVARHALELEGGAWQSASLDLGAAAPSTCKLRFELAVPGGEPVACALADLWVGQRSARAPTVLLVTSDTHRGDHLGSAGLEADISTPVLDALARRGVLFEDCYSAINNTIPSHASLFTGLSPRRTGLLSNFERLSPQAHTLGDAFRAGGFRTFGVYSVPHLGAAEGNVAQGFDRLEPAGGEGNAREAVAKLASWLGEAEGQPLFVWVHLFDAHQPYGPPGAEDLGDDPAALYRAEIDYLDGQLAGLFGHPRLASGVIAFSADHGEVLGKPGAEFDHTLLLPSTLHVPLILAWPGAPAGTRVGAPVSLKDLGRTLLDLGGLAASPFPGSSLTALLEPGPVRATPRFALGDAGTYAGVTAEKYYLVLQLGERGRGGMELQRHQAALFDRHADPACLEDLSAGQPERARVLRALLVEWLNRPTGESLGQASELSPERLEALRALGYTGEDEEAPGGAWIDPQCPCEHCVAGRA